MATRTQRRAERRAPLSQDRVLEAAVRLADDGGITTLSMRKLAQELGVEAMSLYNHVANKDELLDAMVDAVFGEIGLPSARADWRISMRLDSLRERSFSFTVRRARARYLAEYLGRPAQPISRSTTEASPVPGGRSRSTTIAASSSSVSR